MQENCYEEIIGCIQTHGQVIPSECNYVNAVIEETFRLRPIADTVPHIAIENVELDGHLIPKKTIILASLLAPCVNPDIFENPLRFDPNRHLVNGIFKQHSHVRPFSVGLRDCPGKRIAKMELFNFTTNIIKTFKVSEPLNHDNLEIEEHMTIFQAKKMKLIFTEREESHE